MRKNCQQVVRAYKQGKAHSPSRSIWTDGRTIYSYGTALVEPMPDGQGLALNRTSYSTTTTIHQNALAAYFGPDVVVTLHDVPRGTRSLEPYVLEEEDGDEGTPA